MNRLENIEIGVKDVNKVFPYEWINDNVKNRSFVPPTEAKRSHLCNGHNAMLEWLPLCFQKPTQNRALYCEHLNRKVQKNDTIMCIMDRNEIPDTYLRQGNLKNCETLP